MKTMIAVLAFITAAPTFAAQAKTLKCSNPSNPSGLVLDVAADQQSATLSRKSEGGTEELDFGHLNCQRVKPLNIHPIPDMATVFLSCSSPNIADAGYTVSISAGGFVFRTIAAVSAETIGGPVSVESSLICQ